jgi:hypothetical protein
MSGLLLLLLSLWAFFWCINKLRQPPPTHYRQPLKARTSAGELEADISIESNDPERVWSAVQQTFNFWATTFVAPKTIDHSISLQNTLRWSFASVRVVDLKYTADPPPEFKEPELSPTEQVFKSMDKAEETLRALHKREQGIDPDLEKMMLGPDSIAEHLRKVSRHRVLRIVNPSGE